jgi:tetratricopeptide (TPR) repeat protein
VIEDQPESSYPYLFLGTLYRQQGRGEDAARFFEKYLENKPRGGAFAFVRPDYEIYHQIGTCFPDNPDRAIAEFKKAIALNPDFAVAYADLGRAYMHKKDYDQALNFIRKALTMDEGLFPAYVYAVEVHLARGEPEEARQWMTKAAALFPQEERLWNAFQNKVDSFSP